MMLQIITVLLAITIILLLAYILLQKQPDKKNNPIDEHTISLNKLKESIEVLKSSYGDSSTELNKNISQMYTLLTGSSKAQGQFGEISLKMILEHAGFIENIGYQEQKKIGSEIQLLESKNRKETLEKRLNTLKAQKEKAIIKAML